MRISAKGEYAIRATLDLALHRHDGLVPIQDVARRQGIPQRYLEQVLLLLKRAGFLESKRGAAGGYALVRNPAELAPALQRSLRSMRDGKAVVLDIEIAPDGQPLSESTWYQRHSIAEIRNRKRSG